MGRRQNGCKTLRSIRPAVAARGRTVYIAIGYPDRYSLPHPRPMPDDLRTLPQSAPLIDPFARAITYLRVSVTDRCDFRCVYCMAEDMTFLPKSEVLSIEELERLCRAFVRLGVRKLRLTGGEPLVRRGVMTLIERLGALLDPDGRNGGALDELTLTTNGSQLAMIKNAKKLLSPIGKSLHPLPETKCCVKPSSLG